MKTISLCVLALLTATTATGAQAQDGAELRAALIRDVFQADHPAQAWESLRTRPAVDSALIELAIDLSCSPLVRAQATTFLARIATPIGDAHIMEMVAGNLDPSTVESRAALVGLGARSDEFSTALLQRAVTEGDWRAQHAVILGLVGVRSSRAEELLRLLSQSPRPDVRDAAIRNLNRRESM